MFSYLDPRTLLLGAPLILLSLTVHEYAHARVAGALGDPTARLAGRVTLNPLAHLDLIGTLMLFLGPVGWARPVPYNPAYFRRPRLHTLLVALAGPASNVLLAGLLGLGFRAGSGQGVSGDLGLLVIRGIFMNLGLAFFNLLPIPPLDGSKIAASVLPPDLALQYLRFEPYAPLLLMGLILTGTFTSFSPIWMVIGPFVRFFYLVFTGAGGA